MIRCCSCATRLGNYTTATEEQVSRGYVHDLLGTAGRCRTPAASGCLRELDLSNDISSTMRMPPPRQTQQQTLHTNSRCTQTNVANNNSQTNVHTNKRCTKRIPKYSPTSLYLYLASSVCTDETILLGCKPLDVNLPRRGREYRFRKT